jgi:aminopeptidase N
MSNIIIIFLIMFAVNFSVAQELRTERIRSFDLHHIKINVEPDWKLKKVYGNCLNKLTPLSDTMTVVEFDAVGFNINHIKDLNGTDQDFIYNGEKIFIKLKDAVDVSDTLYFEIDYECYPQRGLYFVYPTELNPELNYQIWTQGQAEDNRFWIATYDYPNDKATSEIFITVESKYKTLSNGYLSGSRTDGQKRTDHWIMDKSHPTYLIMMAAGEFDIIDDHADNIPIQSYVALNDVETGKYSFRNTDRMMRFFNDIFGYKYPWNKYAQIVVDEFVYGGMENTTATVLNRRSLYSREIENDYTSDGLISHELAHQWWGDLTTCSNWDELWLNESFATFSTDLWWEEYHGRDEYDYKILLQSDEAISAQERLGKFPIFGGRITSNTYSKGAATLNTFRHLLGDDIFFRGLTIFLKQNEFQNVVTKDLIDAFNLAYNENLSSDKIANPEMSNWMFDQWIYKAGYPVFEVNYDYDGSSKELVLNVKQVQKIDSITPIFKAPLKIKIKSKNENKEEIINVGKAHDVFRIKLSSPPEMVIFDHGNRIVDSLRFDKPKADWKKQVTDSRDAIDRIMGVRGLNEYSSHDDVLLLLKDLMLNDRYWGVKQEATYVIGRSKTESGRDILFKNYDQLKDSRIKRAVLRSVAFMENENDAEFVMDKIKNEKNNYIVADGIETLGKILPAGKIYDAVMEFINIESHRHVVKNAIVGALKKAADETKAPKVKSALIDIAFGTGTESRVRASAIGALTVYASDEDVKELAMKNIDYNFRFVKSALINLLGNSADENMITFLSDIENRLTDTSLKTSIKNAIKLLEGSG